MADGNNNIPDQTQALLALQQYAQQQAGGGKPGFLFGVIPLDTKVGLGFSSEGLMGKMIMPKKGGKPTLMEKFSASVWEDAKKMCEGVNAVYSGPITSDAPPISGLSSSPGSEGFAWTSTVSGPENSPTITPATIEGVKITTSEGWDR